MNPSADGPAHLRSLFLQAAREILNEPDTALDLRKVAERAGKSRTAPYLVFGKTEEGGGLEALKVAIAVEGFEAMTADVAKRLAWPADPESRLRLLARGYLEFAETNPRLYRLMFGAEVSRAVTGALTDAPPRTEVHELLVVRARLEDLFRWVIEEAQDVGVLEWGDATRQVLGSWALLHGAAMLLLDGQLELAGVMSGEEVAELVLPFLLDEGAGPMGEPARLLAEARTRRGLPPEDVPAGGGTRGRGDPDPELIAELREASRDRIPDEVWDIVARPRGEAPPGLSAVRALVARSSALRRARRARGILEGSRVLWIGEASGGEGGDAPTPPEVQLLEALGVAVTLSTPDGLVSGAGASAASRAGTSATPRARTSRKGQGASAVDLAVLALPGAQGRPEETEAVRRNLSGLPSGLPVIAYTTDLPPQTTRLPGSAGITNDPAELLHLVLDVLERVRG